MFKCNVFYKNQPTHNIIILPIYSLFIHSYCRFIVIVKEKQAQIHELKNEVEKLTNELDLSTCRLDGATQTIAHLKAKGKAKAKAKAKPKAVETTDEDEE